MQILPVATDKHSFRNWFKSDSDPTVVSKNGTQQHLTAEQVTLCQQAKAPDNQTEQLFLDCQAIMKNVLGTSTTVAQLDNQPADKNPTPGQVILQSEPMTLGKSSWACSGTAIVDPRTHRPLQADVSTDSMVTQGGQTGFRWTMAPAEDQGRSVGTLYRMQQLSPDSGGWNDTTWELVDGGAAGWTLTTNNIEHGRYIISP